MSDKGLTLWFTGLSGSGKSTLAQFLTPKLKELGNKVEVLDGDEVRENLSKGLGFSKEDRDTNIRRIGYVANMLARNGVVSITAAISPYASLRRECRDRAEAPFVEVYVKCALDVVEARDTKGLPADGSDAAPPGAACAARPAPVRDVRLRLAAGR